MCVVNPLQYHDTFDFVQDFETEDPQLRSRTWTFQFLVVVVVGEVFKVFPQDMRLAEQNRLAFLLVEVFKIFFSSAVSRDDSFQGFCRTFPRVEKSAQSGRESECEGARALELMDAGGL